MNKRDYESTNDYKKSIEIFKNFVRDILDVVLCQEKVQIKCNQFSLFL